MSKAEDVVDALNFFDSWEDRYKYMIDLGRSLPPMADTLHTEDRLVKGCQSQVWIEPEFKQGKFNFIVDSDALLVRGLLAIVMAAYDGKTPEEILSFEISNYFEQLNLLKHLSPTRGNGLLAMVEKIKQMAQAQP